MTTKTYDSLFVDIQQDRLNTHIAASRLIFIICIFTKELWYNRSFFIFIEPDSKAIDCDNSMVERKSPVCLPAANIS